VDTSAIAVKASISAGFDALWREDLPTARDCFTRAIDTGKAEANAWYGLSVVHRKIGTPAEEHAALDNVIGMDPRHIPALIAKGDLYARAGDLPSATSYFHAVLKLGAAIPTPPPELRQELQRIDALCKRFEQEYEAHLLAAVTRAGAGKQGSERFTQAIDLLLGKRQIYFQQPKHFYFPELPQIQFYERRQFPWAESLERRTDAIRAELRGVLAGGAPEFEPYVQPEAHRPNFNTKGLLNNVDWSACYLIRNGVDVAQMAARCPITMAALREVPLCRIEGRTPSVIFSALRPGARIPPHNGFTNIRLICHLPLIVPGDCALRVGNETRPPREGELVVFDDSIEHEAWNNSNELRVILLFDIWRPELTLQERAQVAATLECIDRFGPRREWSA
jgi:aspartyl/asparaginyl beta-hydroxylase (cupin superfamily)